MELSSAGVNAGVFNQTPIYDFSGSIASSGTPQLIVPVVLNRSYLIIQNISSTAIYIGIGPATATCSISGGVVTSITVVNAGFGYTYPPSVVFLSNLTGPFATPAAIPLNSAPSPIVPASAHANISNGTVSVTLDTGGVGYTKAPYVLLQNDPRDPYGCFSPSSTQGISLIANGSFVMESSAVTTSQIAVNGQGAAGYTVKVIP